MPIINCSRISDQIDDLDPFQQLQRIVGCTYISDLRCDRNANVLAKKYVLRMDLSGYPDAVVDDIAEYLYGDKSFLEKLFNK